jgi:hypothetical protein
MTDAALVNSAIEELAWPADPDCPARRPVSSHVAAKINGRRSSILLMSSYLIDFLQNRGHHHAVGGRSSHETIRMAVTVVTQAQC